MASRPRKTHTDAVMERAYQRVAMNRLARNLRCAHPQVRGLSATQHFALHEFFTAILTAGYKLYRFVPPKDADPIIEDKFKKVFPWDGP